MIKFKFSVFFLFWTWNCCAQWDVGNMELLIEQHKKQHVELTNIKNKELINIPFFEDYKTKMKEVDELKETIHKRLISLRFIIISAKDIIYINNITQSIVNYQVQMINLASTDPELLLIAAKTEYALVKKTISLMEYITLSFNTITFLSNNKQRDQFIKKVIKELRLMRGLAYSVCRQMKQAIRYGVWLSINKQLYNEFINNHNRDRKLVDDILLYYNPSK